MTESASVAAWSLLENEDVERIVGQLARRLSRNTAGVVEFEDAVQEARILVVTKPGEAREKLAHSLNHFHTWLARDLTNAFQTMLAQSSRNHSRDALIEWALDDEPDPEFLKGFRETDDVDHAAVSR